MSRHQTGIIRLQRHITHTAAEVRQLQTILQICQGRLHVNDAQAFWKYNKKTVEGVRTAKVVYELAQQMHIDMPITSEIYKVLYENKDPKQSARDLMLRDLKPEA